MLEYKITWWLPEKIYCLVAWRVLQVLSDGGLLKLNGVKVPPLSLLIPKSVGRHTGPDVSLHACGATGN